MSVIKINPGISMGVCYKEDEKKLIKPAKKDIQHELNRYLTAKKYIIDLMNQAKVKTALDKEILGVQLALINDKVIEKEIIDRINKQDICALDSIEEVYDKYITMLNNSDDDYMKARVLDFIDIKTQLINQLFEEGNKQVLDCNTILVTKQVLPSQVLNLDGYIKGVISFEGSSVTHSAILLREKNLPYVVTKSLNVNDGDYIILDGINGKILINPDQETIKTYLLKQNEIAQIETKIFDHQGYDVGVNISSDVDESILVNKNVSGVSLFRTEFLYLVKHSFPSYDEQVSVYESLLKKAYPKPVVIRTYDIGDDKSLNDEILNTKGLETYFSLYNKEIKIQLRALLLAYKHYDNLVILLPMVKTPLEVEMIKSMIMVENQLVGLKKMPKLGIMIETKEAYENLEAFKDVDYISIGSNDLGQSLYNMNREDIKDFKVYTEKLIDSVINIIQFAEKYEIPCTVCGGLSANKYSIKRLLDIGAKSFGVPISFVIDTHMAIQRHIEASARKNK